MNHNAACAEPCGMYQSTEGAVCNLARANGPGTLDDGQSRNAAKIVVSEDYAAPFVLEAKIRRAVLTFGPDLLLFE